MELNAVIFPKPEPPTYNLEHPNLYFVPKLSQPQRQIPVLFLRNEIKTNRLVIFFHGNAEDINCSG